MTRLNPRQAEAVKYIDGPLLVLAGAGSGKTSVITQKIAYLVEKCNMPARQIAAVTFTNKAAREMKERVGQLLKGKISRGLMVCTFHTLGLNIIRSELNTLGYKAGFSILDQGDAHALLKELLMKDGDLDTDHVELIQHTISNWKNELVTPDQAYSKAESPGEQAIALTYKAYNRALKAYNAFDFDDLIMTPVLLFIEHPEILSKWQRKIRYLLVDEYQDTNGAQYRIVKMLLGGRNGLTVVGDDDQSIYAWRGARPENMNQLGQEYPNLKVVKLEQNYRSTSRILRAANTLIDNNPHEFTKTLWSEMGDGDIIRVIKIANDEIEAERVAQEILEQKLMKGIKFSDFAILYRGNHQSRILEMKLQQFQVPYTISGGTSFFSRQEVKDILAYLRVMVNPADDNAFLRIINTPRRKIGPSTLEKLSLFAKDLNLSMLDAVGNPDLRHHIGQDASARLIDFRRWLLQLKDVGETGDPVKAMTSLIEDIDYQSWLHQNASSDQVAQRRMENVWQLVNQLKQTLVWMQEDEPDTTLEQAINRLLLRDMLEQQQEEEEVPDRVQMLTIHASKGLEYPYVYLVGWEEDLLPHRVSVEEGNVEEERRLAYVALTRAKKGLTITLAAKRKQFGEWQISTPSRFIDELPQTDLERFGFTKPSKEQNEKRGRDTLASLKELLKK